MLAFLAVLATPTRAAQQPATALGVARAVETHYRHAQTLKAVFLETYRAGRDDVRLESGTVYFQRPGRMRWDYESPATKLFLIDGRDVWFYVPADHTATRTRVRESVDWRTPFALLTGKAHFKDLCRRLVIVASQGGPGSPPAGNVVLDCAPRAPADNENGITDALIEVDSASQLVRVTLRQPGDVTTEVRFGNWRENLSLPKSLFEFQPPPGVSVVGAGSTPGP